jgi:teichuronic acid biosynthesis glycosyltransferase TuaC
MMLQHTIDRSVRNTAGSIGPVTCTVNPIDTALQSHLSQRYWEWRRLYDADRQAAPLRHPDCVLSEIQHHPPCGVQSVLVTAEQNGTCVGVGALVPKYASSRQLGGFGIPVSWVGLRLAGNDWLRAIGSDADVALVTAALDHVRAVDAGFLLVQDLEAGSRLDVALSRGVPGSWSQYRHAGVQPHRRIQLPADKKAYWSGFSSKTLSTMRRKLKKFGETRLERITDVTQVPRFLEIAHAISLQTWQTRQFGLRVHNSAAELHLLGTLAQLGLLRSYLWFSNDEPVAFLIGNQDKGRFHYEEVGYATPFAKHSPGQTMLVQVLDDLFDHDRPEWFDFGGGDADYKQLFANHDSRSETALPWRNCARAGACGNGRDKSSFPVDSPTAPVNGCATAVRQNPSARRRVENHNCQAPGEQTIMRILFFSYAYPNSLHPGLGTFNRTMVAGLARDHAVRVVSPIPFVEHFKHSGRWNRQFTAVQGVAAEYPTYYYTPKFFRPHYGRFLDWSVGAALRSTIRGFQPDVMLSYWAHPDGEVAVRAAHEQNMPAAVTVGGSDVLLLARDGRRRQAILQVLHDADAVIAVSEDIAATLRDDGIAADKIHVVGRGIDRSVFSPGDRMSARLELGLPLGRPVLIGVGRLVPVKAWTDWLAACRDLVARGMRPACYVLGSGPLQFEMERLIRECGLQGHVELRGPQPQSELVQWYRAADLTVLSSISEGVPNVLLETLACGGSFVATSVGGIPEIADPLHDRLVPPRAPASLAAAIADRLAHVPPTGVPRRWEPASLETATRRLVKVLASTLSLTPTLTFARNRKVAVEG